MSPLPLRADFSAQTTQSAARRSKDGPQARRLLALTAIYDGATRTEVARIGGVGVQTVRDWVMKFNALGPDDLFDRKAPGQPPRLEDEHRQVLAAVIEKRTDPCYSRRCPLAHRRSLPMVYEGKRKFLLTFCF